MLTKIVSSGQPGAARAALDWAIARGIPHGGWCPKKRHVADGALDLRYRMEETPKRNHLQCKEWNVRDSDGTVVFTLEPDLHGDSKAAFDFALEYEKPCIHIAGKSGSSGSSSLRRFVIDHEIGILNVAGSRESMDLGIYFFVEDSLNEAFPELA